MGSFLFSFVFLTLLFSSLISAEIISDRPYPKSSSSVSSRHPHHITTQTHEILATLNNSNLTKNKSNRWAFSLPAPSKTPDIKDVPKHPMDVSWEEWEKLMPIPVKSDYSPWFDGGFNSTKYKKECTLPSSGGIAYFFEGHVYYSGTGGSNNAKYRKFWKVMGVVADYMYYKYPKLPVITVAFTISSIATLEYDEECPPRTSEYPELPYFVLARRDIDKLIRMPTPYLTPLWAHEASKLYEGRMPWGEKKVKGCWIGATNTMPGGRARLELLAESERLKEQDRAFVDFFDVHPMTHPQKRFHAWKKLGYFSNITFEYIRKSGTVHKQHTNFFGRCRYNFHLPGHTKGGYSRALQTLLPQGTAILKYENPWNEFYYDWLVEGKHYASYTNSTLKQTVQYFLRNDKKGEQMAEAAADFYLEHLTWDDILRYWEWLMLTHLKLDNSAQHIKIPRSACQCHLDEKRFEGRCVFCSAHHQAMRRQKKREKALKSLSDKEAIKMLVADGNGEEEDDDGDGDGEAD